MKECNFKFKYRHFNKQNESRCRLTGNSEVRNEMVCPGKDNCFLFKNLSKR